MPPLSSKALALVRETTAHSFYADGTPGRKPTCVKALDCEGWFSKRDPDTGKVRACAVRSKSTTRLFLKRGGNPYVTDRYGHTAFDYANGRAVPRMLRKYIAIDIRLCVLGTAAEYPRRNRLRDLIPHIASFIV